MSTKSKILTYLRTHPGWISGSQLEMQAYEFRSKPSTIARRCRELAESGAIEREVKGKMVQYRIRQIEVITRYTSKDTVRKKPSFDSIYQKKLVESRIVVSKILDQTPNIEQRALFDLPKRRTLS